jgi:acyl-CoA-binding protein
MAGTMLPGTMPVGGMPGTTMVGPPPGTMIGPQRSSFNYYDPRYLEDPRLPSLWDRNSSFKSTYSGSSHDESKPLKGSGKKPKGKPVFIKKTAPKDQPIQLGTYGFATFVAICAVYLVVESSMPMQSEEFLTFSQLGYQCWYPSLFAFVCVLCFLGLCGIILALVACIGASTLRKPVLKAVMGSSVALGLILLAIAAAFYYYGQQAKPSVVRVANLICQDPSVWCENLPTTTTTTTSSPVEEAPSGAPSSIQGPPRRLEHEAEAAINYDKMLLDISPNMPCDQVMAMCRPPPHFDPFRACMCSGQWDFSGHLPTSTSTTGIAVTTTTSTTGLTNATAEADTGLLRRLTEASEAEANQLPPEAPGPWYGSMGAYCGNWDGGPREWCFVYDSAQCASSLVTPRNTSDGRQYFSSNGPCGNDVDSRSEYILDGLDATIRPSIVAAVLGVLLFILSCCAVAMSQVEPAKPEQEKVGKKKEPRPATLEDQFVQAQKDAVQKLRDQTPESYKLDLYGFYKQAKEGSSGLGMRPTGIMNRKEQQKWDSWYSKRDLTREEAIEEYITMVRRLE